ncbi:MAG: LacI family transcriptional regulator [Bauldia sp.]|nr:LacI family transcriptional regulator [Bauldia sp.]
MRNKATIADVARRAGVSPTAVSRWLNGSIRLPPATGDRIRSAVADLKYQPHAQARRLSRGKADAIGIIVPDIANPFFALLAGEAERVAVAEGYDVVIWSSRNQIDRELACFDRLAAGYIDGLLLITNHEDDGRLAERVAAAPRRVVIIDEDVHQTEVPKFFVENELGGYIATRHLIDSGHRRIAHMGGPRGVMSAVERASGWRRALAEIGIAAPAEWQIFSEYEVDPARADAAALFTISPAPTAVFAGSDAIALGIMHQARERGVVIPADLSLVGFDGMPITELLGPPLTSVAQPIDSLGRLGAKRLVAMIDAAAPSAADTVRLPVVLTTRGSVAPPKD